jgi:hypothetical protein
MALFWIHNSGFQHTCHRLGITSHDNKLTKYQAVKTFLAGSNDLVQLSKLWPLSMGDIRQGTQYRAAWRSGNGHMWYVFDLNLYKHIGYID